MPGCRRTPAGCRPADCSFAVSPAAAQVPTRSFHSLFRTFFQAVALDYRTLPSGPYLKYSGGRTLTHELGHYFSLLHVFGSCATASGGSDSVSGEACGGLGRALQGGRRLATVV